MRDTPSLLSRVVTWSIVGILAVLAIKLAIRLLAFLFGIMGMLFGMVAFLLFTVGPVLLVGWMAAKAWGAFTKEPAV